MPHDSPLPQILKLDRYASPVGEILLITDEHDQLRALDFHDYNERLQRLLIRHYGHANVMSGAASSVIRDALDAYFNGDLTAIDAIPYASGGTPFQRSVWEGLRKIPAGETWSYAKLASHISNPKAVRAVGLANGANPIGIVVPCHRVIGANGTLTGYGGGLDRKLWLLRHEGATTKLLL